MNTIGGIVFPYDNPRYYSAKALSKDERVCGRKD